VAAEAVERAGGPEEARAALQVIRTASREALGEMKSILAVLRSGDAAPDRVPDDRPGRPGERDGPGPGGPRRDGRPPGDRGPGGHAAGNREPRGNHEPRGNREHRAAADRRPLPGIDRLRDLIAGAGVDVEFRTLGEERTLPPAVGLTVYRVIQEALTNTMRHAHATRAWVTLRFEPDGVGVRVADDGRGAPEDGPRPGGGSGGLGLLGMRERVAAMNGRLTVGNRPGGGFQVEAWLPVETA
jgi:signal transduction histidine kinase